MNNYFFILSEQSKIVTLFCGWIFKARVEEEGIVLVNKCFVLYVLDDLVGFFVFFFWLPWIVLPWFRFSLPVWHCKEK